MKIINIIKNNKGPRTEPCGTPHEILSSVHNSSRREAGTSRVKAPVSTKIPRQIMEVEGDVSFSGEESKPSCGNN